MRRLMLMMAVMVMFLMGTHFAEATVIYDWVSVGFTEGAEYRVGASLKITEPEYYSGTFAMTYASLEEVVLMAYRQDGTKYFEFPLQPQMFEGWVDFILLGTLSADKRKIDTLKMYVPEYQVYQDWFSFMDGTQDIGVALTVGSVKGSMDPICFPYDGYLTYYWDHTGEWEVRSVPEPGTILLLGVGMIGIVFWRRSAKR